MHATRERLEYCDGVEKGIMTMGKIYMKEMVQLIRELGKKKKKEKKKKVEKVGKG